MLVRNSGGLSEADLGSSTADFLLIVKTDSLSAGPVCSRSVQFVILGCVPLSLLLIADLQCYFCISRFSACLPYSYTADPAELLLGAAGTADLTLCVL